MLNIGWAHAGPSILAAFLASLVEFVEALTVVLAIGSVRGWRDALLGSAAALGVMLVLIVALGGALARIPLGDIQLVVGACCCCSGCAGYARPFCARPVSSHCTTRPRRSASMPS